MKIYRIAAVMLTLLLTVLPGCGNSGGSKMDSYARTEVAAAPGEAKNADTAGQAAEGTADAGSGSDSVGQVTDPNRKLIKTQNYSVETKAFDKFLNQLNELVNTSKGYVEQSDVQGSADSDSQNRYATYTLRIPVDNLEDFKSSVGKQVTITHFSEQVQDVTLNYVDTESHITALKAEQETLIAMLEKAENLESIIAIQNRLTEVRYQLESYESQIRTYDNEIQYSTITLNISEVEREIQVSESFGGQLKERLSRNMYSIQKGIYSFTLWFLGAIPYWVIAGILILIICLVIKAIKKHYEKLDLIEEEKAGLGKKPHLDADKKEADENKE